MNTQPPQHSPPLKFMSLPTPPYSPSPRATPSFKRPQNVVTTVPRFLPSRKYTLNQNDDPLDLLCRHFNVAKAVFEPGSPLPTTFDMQPIMVPIHAELYAQCFRSNILPQSPPGTALPVPYWVPPLRAQVVSLPVVPTLVPHAPSIPLLLLYVLGVEVRGRILSCSLLPSEVIEEFPSVAAMAQVMARICDDDQFHKYLRYNQGLWKNILALGPHDTSLMEVVQTVWNVTAEARRIRKHYLGR
ncbi:hypothetical protein SERLADRAFT_464450 [Serpula lacrymans var. lacrymans S7.9]|uniref:Uncharacterized protein n=1 Tax=Serpula lacrymans var. lacrymans (strain S7.9) TaxID=578457 RepID=F8NS49_SERL9|nr:uncharacterized protein SERLADRAFT_464450 [Serpula lacrymans var. lacrymans S7.9]EGO26882.1 hypothetical protein SERLADRAFT_464450 [Serpula lacrymans var. lacrymans S7.9]